MSRFYTPRTTSTTDNRADRAWAWQLVHAAAGRPWRAALVLFVVFSVLAPGGGRPAQARLQQAVTTTPVLQLSPTAGLAGSTVALNGGGYPRVADLAPATISFDGTNLGTIKISGCSSLGAVALLSFGFGTTCNGTAVTITVPQTASPGPHTITVTGNDGQGGTYPASATFTVLAPPAMDLNPNSGLAGSNTSLSVLYFPGTTAQQQAAVTFDGAAAGQVQVVPCTASGQPSSSFGFGTDCTGTAVTLQIPQSAQPGPHTVNVTAPAPNDPAGSVSVTGVFTVTTPEATGTATPSATPTAAPSAAITATGTISPVPATGTATATTTILIPTAAATVTPSVTATATATPVRRPGLLLVKPVFDSDSVYLVLSADPHAPVHISLQVVTITGGTSSPQYTLNAAGVANARGLYSAVLHLAFHKHIQGRANLLVTTIRAGHMVKASRSFGYGVTL